MTSLERRQDYSPAQSVEMDLSRGATSLVTWALEADAAYQLAQKLVDTTFCPKQYRGKPAEAAAAMLAGAEVGLSPMASLRSFDDIQGTAAPRALTLRAIAQAHGCEFVTVSESSDKVVVKGRRRGGEWDTVTWTMERARGLALHTKDNWRKQPQAMLMARATSELARRIAADAILGIPYSSEEIEDSFEDAVATKRTVKRATPAPVAEESERPALPGEDDPDPAEATPQPEPTPPPKATARVKPRQPRPAALPPLPDEDEASERPEPEPLPAGSAGVTQPQLRHIHASFGDIGLSERQPRLDYASKVLGRTVASSLDLTRSEAHQLIEALIAPPFEDAELVEDVPHPDEFAE